MNTYYVYKHTNKINNKVYIGITRQKPTARWKGNGVGYKPKKENTSRLYNAILKYGWNNFNHEILYSGLSKEQAEEKEIELIAKYKSDQQEYGYNIDHGGNATGKMSESTIQKLIEIHKDKEKNKIRYQKISEARKGMVFSEEHKKHLSEAKKGKSFGKNNNNHRDVIQYDLDMNFIKEFGSLADAQRELKVSSANICRAIKYDRTCGGYKWKYKE